MYPVLTHIHSMQNNVFILFLLTAATTGVGLPYLWLDMQSITRTGNSQFFERRFTVNRLLHTGIYAVSKAIPETNFEDDRCMDEVALCQTSYFGMN